LKVGDLVGQKNTNWIKRQFCREKLTIGGKSTIQCNKFFIEVKKSQN